MKQTWSGSLGISHSRWGESNLFKTPNIKNDIRGNKGNNNCLC